jgi:thiol reductant ABC exporter CydD subunit
VKPFDPRLLRHARGARLPIAAVAGFGALAAGLIIVQAQLLADGITTVFNGTALNGTALAGTALAGGAAPGALRGILVALAAVLAGRVVVAWAGEIASYRASAAVKSELRRRLLARAVELGPRWLAGRRRAELTALATEGIEALDGYFAKCLPQLVLAAIVPVAVLVRVGLADPLAAVTIAATLPLVPLFGALVGKATGDYAQQRWRALAVLSHHFLDVVSGLPTLKVFGRSKEQRAVIGQVTGDYRRATMGTLRLAFLSSLVLELVATLSVALVAVGVGLSLVYGHLSLRTGLLALILAPEAYLPLRQAAAQFHASADGLAAAAAAIEVIETPVPVAAPVTEARRLHPIEQIDPIRTIRAETVSVTHEGRACPAPDRFSAVFQAGQLSVLAGPSGSGKSTLIDALLGFAEPSAGRLLIDDDDLALLDKDAWRARVGWVPQQPYLFPGTVAANIRLGWPAAPDEAVAAAARAAALGDMPLGRLVTERGGGLSSGQRRRVALARALLPGRPVLLLDEPTAGLDAAAEEQVLDTLRAQAAAGRVVLIAAHHPRVIAAADQVVWLADDATPAPDPGITPPAPAAAPAAQPAQREQVPA